MNRLFISTKEAYIPYEEVTHAQFFYKDELAEQQKRRAIVAVELFGGRDNQLGTIDISSQEEALWFMKSIFVNLNVKEQLIMDYTQQKIIHVRSVSIPLAQVTQEEEREIKETHSSIQSLELEEK